MRASARCHTRERARGRTAMHVEFGNLPLFVRRLIDDVESKCIAMFDGALVPDFGKSQTQAELQVFAKRSLIVGVIVFP